MEYATKINGDICNLNYVRYVGYEESNECIKKFFSQETVNLISKKVTGLLMGVDPQNRPIKVPDSTICTVMSTVNENYQPPVGDIYSRYIIPTGENAVSMMQNMIDQVIEIITSDVRNNLEMEQNNKKLTAWTTLLGDFNQHNLRSHAPIKILEKRPCTFPISHEILILYDSFHIKYFITTIQEEQIAIHKFRLF